MNWFRSGDLRDRAFAVGIILKGLDGVLEVVGGVLLLVVSPTTIDQLSRAITQHELSEDPHDFLASHLLHAAGSLTGSSLKFGAAAWRSQDRARDSAAQEQGLGLPVDDRLPDRVHRVSGLPNDLCVFHWASRADGLRSGGCLAHLSGIRQAARRADAERLNQDVGAIAR